MVVTVLYSIVDSPKWFPVRNTIGESEPNRTI